MRRFGEFSWSAVHGLSDPPTGLAMGPGPSKAPAPISCTNKCGIRTQCARKSLFLAEARLNRDALASLGATARNDGTTGLGLHTSTETVRFRTFTPVWLKCALRHERTALLCQRKLDLGKLKV